MRLQFHHVQSIFYLPVRKIAFEAGNALIANFILMGAYAEATKAFPVELFEEVLEKTSKGIVREKLLSANKNALHEGIRLIANYSESVMSG